MHVGRNECILVSRRNLLLQVTVRIRCLNSYPIRVGGFGHESSKIKMLVLVVTNNVSKKKIFQFHTHKKKHYITVCQLVLLRKPYWGHAQCVGRLGWHPHGVLFYMVLGFSLDLEGGVKAPFTPVPVPGTGKGEHGES